jgi:2-methylcitrate dehydratase PrpD
MANNSIAMPGRGAGDIVPVTTELGRWASELSFSDVPASVISHMKTCILDGIGCALYGAEQPWGKIASDVAMISSGGRGVSLIGHAQTVNPMDAALANGTALHGFEIDDIHVSSSYHPASVTIPAALAVVEDRSLSGQTLLCALIAGYEVGIRVGICAGVTHSTSGFHVTGTVGPIGSAAAVARALGLDPRRAMHAIAVGATQASGLYSARMGAMAKRFHAGRASQSGVLAGMLAEKGFTGSTVALEAPFGGFMSAFHGQFEPSTILSNLGSEWETARVGFKVYAACASAHTTVDAIQEMIEQGLSAENMEQLTIWMTKKGHTNVGWDYVPAGIVSAQMNGYYTAAVKLLDGDAFIDQYREDRLDDPRILELIRRIRILHDPELDAGGAAKRHTVRVEARLRDGRTLQAIVQNRLGSAERPISRSNIEKKFRQLTRGRLNEGVADEIIGIVDDLENETTIKRLMRLVAGG